MSNNIIQNILSGLASPINNFTTGISEQLRQANGLGTQNGTYKPAYMSPSDWQQYVQNPIGKNLQNIAGMASYVPQILAPEASPLILGGISGGLNAIGQNNATQNLDIGNVIKSSAIGGAGGVVLNKLFSKILPGASKISNGDQAFTEVGIDPNIAKTADYLATPKLDAQGNPLSTGNAQLDAMGNPVPTGNAIEQLGKETLLQHKMGINYLPNDTNFYTNGQQFKADVSNILDINNLPYNEAGQQGLKQVLGGTKSYLMNNSGYSGAPISDVLSSVNNIAQNDLGISPLKIENINSLAKSQLFDKVSPQTVTEFNEFMQGNKVLSPQAQDEIRQVIGPTARKVFNKLDNGGTPTTNEYTAYALDSALKSNLQTNVPGYSKANELWAGLINRNEPMSAAASQSGFSTGFYGKPRPTPSLLYDLYGNALKKIGGGLGNLGGSSPLGGVTGAIGGQIGGALTSGTQSASEQPTSIDPNSSQQVGATSSSAPDVSSPNIQQMLHLAAAAGMDPSAVGILMQRAGLNNPFYVPTADQATQSNQTVANLSALQSLAKTIQDNPTLVGPQNNLPVIGGMINQVAGLTNPQAQHSITAGLNAIPGMLQSVGLSGAQGYLSPGQSSGDLVSQINTLAQLMMQAEAQKQQSAVSPLQTFVHF